MPKATFYRSVKLIRFAHFRWNLNQELHRVPSSWYLTGSVTATRPTWKLITSTTATPWPLRRRCSTSRSPFRSMVVSSACSPNPTETGLNQKNINRGSGSFNWRVFLGLRRPTEPCGSSRSCRSTPKTTASDHSEPVSSWAMALARKAPLPLSSTARAPLCLVPNSSLSDRGIDFLWSREGLSLVSSPKSNLWMWIFLFHLIPISEIRFVLNPETKL